MEDLDKIARRRAGAKLGFYLHASIFAVVNLALYLINTELNPGRLWHVWPLAGWGIGIAFHGLGVFFLGSGSSLRQRMIERERQLLDDQSR